MVHLKGRLEYLGWLNRPWKLIAAETGAVIDLWPCFESSFKLWNLTGEGVKMNLERDSFSLLPDPKAGDVVEYKPGMAPFLKKRVGFGGSNLLAYIEMALGMINGRNVVMEYEIGVAGLTISADPEEKVFGLYFTDGNSCAIPKGKEEEICKVQSPDCCVFLAASADGFTCEKFNSSTARLLLDRVDKGTIRARRIGNCALLGRKEDPEKEKRKTEAAAERLKKFCDGRLVGRKVRHRETMPTFTAEGIVKSLTIEDGSLVLRAGWDLEPSIAVNYAAVTENPDGSVEICSVGYMGGNTWEFSPPN